MCYLPLSLMVLELCMDVCVLQAHYETCEFIAVVCEVCGQRVLKREVSSNSKSAQN